MSEIVIRPWTRDDLQAIRDIAWKTWLATYSSFIPEEDLQTFLDEFYSIAALTKLLNSTQARTFIAEIHANAVGFSKTNFNDTDNRFYVASLYVLPEFQGKGIGTRLMNASEEFAFTFGVDSIWLGVMTQNVDALNWYKRIGFQFVREEPFTMGKTTVQHLIGFRTIKRNQLHGN